MSFRLRYIPGTPAGEKFPTITYPLRYRPGFPTPAHAQAVLASMPDPNRMEIFEEGT